MFKFGAKSLAELEGVKPELVTVVKEALELTKQDFTVFDGIRTLKEQHEMLASGASHTLKSMHLVQSDGYGHAVDLVPFIAGRLRWEWEPIYKIAHAVARAAKKHNVTVQWGGVWDKTLDQLDTSSPETLKREVELYVARRKAQGLRAFIDGPHFELA